MAGKIAEKIAVPMDEVDAHNIVPCWLSFNKQEFGVPTPKIAPHAAGVLDDFPELKNILMRGKPEVDFAAAEAFAKGGSQCGPSTAFTPGSEKAARKLFF